MPERPDGERHARLDNCSLTSETSPGRCGPASIECPRRCVVLPITRVFNHIARGAVQVAHAHARRDERLGGLARAAHDVIDARRAPSSGLALKDVRVMSEQ